jgi:endonuclease/exonuclease/phosphatase (EEP) superfamily protein YafD
MDRLARAIAAATLVATAFTLLADRWWIFDLFSHFRAQYLFTQCALLALFAARRRARWALALLPFLGANAAALAPYLPWATSQASEPGAAIEIMSVNLNGHNTRYGDLLDLVRAQSPDLLFLSEFKSGWADALRELPSEYRYRIRWPRQDNYGVALYSRLPLAEAREIELRSTPAIDVSIAVNGRLVRFLGVHLRSPTSSRRARQRNRQLQDLGQRVARRTEPMIVAGDFNSTPFSPFFRRWLARTGMRDGGRGLGLSFTWPTFLPILGIPIDHCTVSEEFFVLDNRRLPAIGSDHYPLRTTLLLGDGR